MIDTSDLYASPRFEVDRPVSSVPAPPFPTGAVQSFRRCHRDGLMLDLYGDCARCSEARWHAEARARRQRWIALALALGAVLAAVAFGWWRIRANEQAGQRAAVVISARNDNRLTVYTMRGCPACTMAVSYMNAQGIDYVERPIDGDYSAMAELASLKGRGVVPTFVIKGEVIEGFDQRGVEGALTKHGMRKSAPSP